MRRQHSDSAARDSGANAVRPTRKNDWYLRTQYQTGTVGVRQETELLGEHVSGFEIRGQEDVWVPGDIRHDALCLCRLLADGVVKCQRAVQLCAFNLPSLRHLAEC